MKPKIVSVKELKIRIVPPPSEPEWVFVERHGHQVEEKPTKTGNKKRFFEWVYKLFGV